MKLLIRLSFFFSTGGGFRVLLSCSDDRVTHSYLLFVLSFTIHSPQGDPVLSLVIVDAYIYIYRSRPESSVMMIHSRVMMMMKKMVLSGLVLLLSSSIIATQSSASEDRHLRKLFADFLIEHGKVSAK